MNKRLLFFLLLNPNINATKPEATSVEIVDIDLVSEQSTTVDNVSTVVDKTSTTETRPQVISKTTRKLKLKISVFAALGSFLTGSSALIWKYIRK